MTHDIKDEVDVDKLISEGWRLIDVNWVVEPYWNTLFRDYLKEPEGKAILLSYQEKKDVKEDSRPPNEYGSFRNIKRGIALVSPESIKRMQEALASGEYQKQLDQFGENTLNETIH